MNHQQDGEQQDRDDHPADAAGQPRGQSVLDLLDPTGDEVAGLLLGVRPDGQRGQSVAVGVDRPPQPRRGRDGGHRGQVGRDVE